VNKDLVDSTETEQQSTDQMIWCRPQEQKESRFVIKPILRFMVFSIIATVPTSRYRLKNISTNQCFYI